MTMNGCPLLSSMSWMVQMCGWLSSDAARASREKRSNDCRISGEMFGDELQGNMSAQSCVLGLVNHAHPAPAQLREDAVM